jgi:hypothetical protein
MKIVKTVGKLYNIENDKLYSKLCYLIHLYETLCK